MNVIQSKISNGLILLNKSIKIFEFELMFIFVFLFTKEYTFVNL